MSSNSFSRSKHCVSFSGEAGEHSVGEQPVGEQSPGEHSARLSPVELSAR